MSDKATIRPMMKARIRLAPELTKLLLNAQERARELATELKRLPPSQLRGLANALASGSSQRTLAGRRLALAQFLAWRAVRAQREEETSPDERESVDAWRLLADKLGEEIERLEEDCRMTIEWLRDTQTAYWITHTETLEEAQSWLILIVSEVFIHTLVRMAIIHQQAEQSAEATTVTTGESHANPG